MLGKLEHRLHRAPASNPEALQRLEEFTAGSLADTVRPRSPVLGVIDPAQTQGSSKAFAGRSFEASVTDPVDRDRKRTA